MTLGHIARFVGKLLLRSTDTAAAALEKWLPISAGGSTTAAGIFVNPHTGTRQEIVYICIKRLSDAIAMTPWPVFRQLTRGRDEARDHSVWRVLNIQANRDMTAFTWKQVTAAHVLGWGNAFSFISRDPGGRVRELIPMHPDNVRIIGRTAAGHIIYEWQFQDPAEPMAAYTPVKLTSPDVLHIRGLTWDGICGISPIMHLRELIGRAKAREDFQSRFYGNGCVFGGAITTPEELTDDQVKRQRETFEKLYKGSGNAWKILLLEGSQKFTPFGVNPKDAEFVETGKLDAARIAAAYGVPLQLINDVEAGAARASAEQLFREYLMMGVNPWFANFEGQANISLLTPQEQASLFSEFDREYLTAADSATMVDGLQKKVLSAIITPNEARKRLNLNPIEGGDALLAPVNMMPIEMLGADREIETNQDGSVARVKLLKPPVAALPPAN